MVQTRAQKADVTGSTGQDRSTREAADSTEIHEKGHGVGKKQDQQQKSKPHDEHSGEAVERKRGSPEPEPEPKPEADPDGKKKSHDDEPPMKKARLDSSSEHEIESKSSSAAAKLEELLFQYGHDPLSDLGLTDTTSSSASTILAHLLYALLTSARISHQIAAKTCSVLLKEGYHHLDTLQKSTWEQRCDILTQGGYARYRERTATQFGELVEFVQDRYDGDLNNVRKKADDNLEEIRRRMKEVKGLGDVGVEIFLGGVQGVWSCVAPFVQSRDIETARRLGITQAQDDKDVVQDIWQLVDRDAQKMARVDAALTKVRLEHREKELQET